MSLKVLGSLLESAPQFRRLSKSVKRFRAPGRVQVLADAVPFALVTLWQNLKLPILALTPQPEAARHLYEQLVLWSGKDERVLHFPETETLPFERLVSDINTTHRRLRTLSVLTDGHKRTPIVVASAAAVAQKTIDREVFTTSTHALQLNQRVDVNELLNQWQKMGYQFKPAVYSPGLVSRRGGILDIFPIGSSLPARIELWGNEINSIRLFDPATQRSMDMVDSITIIPAQEALTGLTDHDHLDKLVASIDVSNCTQPTRDRIAEELNLLLAGHEVEESTFYSGFFNRASLIDYFPRDGLLVALWPSEIARAARATDDRAHKLRRAKEMRGELPLHFPSPQLLWKEVEEHATEIKGRIDITSWGEDGLTNEGAHTLPFTSTPAFMRKFDSFVNEAVELARDGHRVVAVTSHSNRLGEILENHGVDPELPGLLNQVPRPGSITVLQSDNIALSSGFVLSMNGQKLAVFSDLEIFGVTKQRRTLRRTGAWREAFLSEMSLGDYVVHVEHGIGRFVGTGSMPNDREGLEYLILQYSQDDRLYVPMEHLDRVTSYIAPMEHPPSLTRLGTQEWKRTKERVERSAREMAGELLTLYAARELVKGHPFSADTPWQSELEEAFPYEETPDQLEASAQIKASMELNKPMDRLVCGDVGYGKTEIALRAAFKAVMDGKQVAVLVPTTVLAQQHYVTFSQRLSAYPTTVEVLSRFRTGQEQRAILDGITTGRVDICIGTHRLVQRDVRFKDLGLVIIDEEQRFGVAHKERLKQMRKEVDVLTLTATPIPRTLYMSLAGVRDMSTIETPPEERLPIKTYVSEFSDELVREAILRELDRQGQIYFLHNRVHTIDYMAEYVRRLVPEAQVGIAHGQMPEGELEQAMIDFAARKMDVLLCTTIIESGLDIPNVNTLIINRADTFGLGQLYQLRGRVGRSARRAYAYLLIPETRSLTAAANQRLKAMLAATELGAGFHIAMKDLEIRGAGNILGAEQSGNIHAVGFELYTRLLSNAAEQLRAQRAENEAAVPDDKSEPITSRIDHQRLDHDASLNKTLNPFPPISVDLNIPANIPKDYIADLATRLEIYQRLVRVTTLDAVREMEEDLRDRFGPLPWQVRNLLYVTQLKVHAHSAGIESMTMDRDRKRIVLRLRDEVGGARRPLQQLLGDNVEVGHTQIRLTLTPLIDGWEELLTDMVSKVADFRERMAVRALDALD